MVKDVLTGDDLMTIIIDVPKQAVKLEVNATIIDNKTDELYKTTSTLNLADITEARIAGDEWEGENVKYCLTDSAKKELEEKGYIDIN